MAEELSLEAERTTDQNGVYKLDVPAAGGFDCREGHDLRSACRATLVRSSSAACNVPGLRGSTQHIALRSRATNACFLNLNALNFRPPSATPRSATAAMAPAPAAAPRSARRSSSGRSCRSSGRRTGSRAAAAGRCRSRGRSPCRTGWCHSCGRRSCHSRCTSRRRRAPRRRRSTASRLPKKHHHLSLRPEKVQKKKNLPRLILDSSCLAAREVV